MTDFAWNAKLVTEALGLPPATWDHAYRGLSTDTRTMGEGQLFIALKGERFDAHDFLGDARLAGVGGVVVRKGTPRWPGFDWFEVDDTLVALGRLARLRRDRFTGPVVAITGSNGKTSTQELTAAALSPKYSVHRSAKNLNNLVGVPQTVLAAPLEATAMVVECGASLKGELARQREIVHPDVGVVTLVGAAHLEGFGSQEAVLAEKVSLIEGAANAVVGTSPASLPEAARRAARKLITVSIEGPSDWKADSVTMLPDGRARFTVRGVAVELPLAGRHMVGNAIIALAVADILGVPLPDAAGALAGTRIPGGRSDLFEADGCLVIDDSYNANPASLRAALDLLTSVRGARRAVVVVGTMRELGQASAALHRDAARAVLETGPAVIAAIGEFAPAFAELGAGGAELVSGATPVEVAEPLKGLVRPGDVILLKASRGVALEQLIPILWPSHHPTEAH